MTDQQTEVIRCAWECDAGEIRDAVTGGRFSCNLREESIAHRHSAECPADHEDWYACHRFVAPRAAAPAASSGNVEAYIASVDPLDLIVMQRVRNGTRTFWQVYSMPNTDSPRMGGEGLTLGEAIRLAQAPSPKRQTR